MWFFDSSPLVRITLRIWVSDQHTSCQFLELLRTTPKTRILLKACQLVAFLAYTHILLQVNLIQKERRFFYLGRSRTGDHCSKQITVVQFLCEDKNRNDAIQEVCREHRPQTNRTFRCDTQYSEWAARKDSSHSSVYAFQSEVSTELSEL